jgi:multidrug efflux pump subunit AcrA (membrane-fusion protein)
MMRLARVVRGDAIPSGSLWRPGPSETQWRRLSGEELAARARVEAIGKEAQTEADAIRARARMAAEASVAEREARERAQAALDAYPSDASVLREPLTTAGSRHAVDRDS